MVKNGNSGDNWFVVDAPITDVALDAFGHDDVADNLYRMVTEPTSSRRMIGLFGEFGVGKSTVIELLKDKLSGSRDFALVRMSAERHEPVGFHRAAVYGFAEALVDSKQISESDADRILEPLRTAQTASMADAALSPAAQLFSRVQRAMEGSWIKVLGWGLLAAVIAIVLILVAPLVFGPQIWSNISAWFSAFVTVALVGVLLAFLTSSIGGGLLKQIGRLLEPGTRTVQWAKVEAADEQERAFAELVDKADRRLVVAVDDIDRSASRPMVKGCPFLSRYSSPQYLIIGELMASPHTQLLA